MKTYIRPLCIEDANTSYKWRNDTEVWHLTGNCPNKEITKEIESEWLKKILTNSDEARFAIIEKTKNVYIGNIYLTNIKDKTAQYHIFIGNKQYWGQGYAYEASILIIEYAKTQLFLETIFLKVNAKHINAIFLYHKLGFEITSLEEDTYTMELRFKKNNPVVSVFVMTYNHEKYIKQALDGILIQRNVECIEVVIGDDCSQDNTRNILLDYKAKYPNIIRLLLHPKNIGAHNNQLEVMKRCQGKYVAICEGDDYWTNPYKLQKQVDFLEQNLDFNICCHRAKVLNEIKKTIKTPKPLKQTVFIQEDVANHNFLQTLTEVFRNSAWKGLSDGYFSSISGDYFINMMLSENGKVKYLPDVMAVYRQHETGSWNSLGKIKGLQNTLSVLNYYLQTDLKDSVKEKLKQNIVRHYLLLYVAQKKNGNVIEAKDTLSKVFAPDFLTELDIELIKFIEQQNKKEVKIGRFLLKPYYLFRNFLFKINFYLHRLKYE